MAKKIYTQIPMRTWRWLGVNEAQVEEAALAVNTKLVPQNIQVEANQSQRLTVVHRDGGAKELFVDVAENGFLKLTIVQLSEADEYAARTHIRLAERARAEIVTIEAGAEKCVHELKAELKGDESAANIYALYFGDKERKLDMNYIMEQKGKRTEANMYVFGALTGQADKIFRGTLDFQRGSKGSKGYEKEQVVVLSGKVRNRSVPLMLSGEDAVEGHHAVSAGKIDHDKLFYLMSRGLDQTEAKRLVVEAAFNPVLDRVEDEALRQELDGYIKERL